MADAIQMIELFHADGKSASVFYCSKCRSVATSKDQPCCQDRSCACGNSTLSRYQSQCDACRKEADRKAAAKRLEDAQEIPSADFSDWVYCDGYGHKDGFFESLEDLVEWLDENHDPEEMGPRPAWAFACDSQPPQSVDIGDVLEDMFSDSFEEADEQAVEEDALSIALNAFWEANKHIVSWSPDYRRKIRVPGESNG